MFYLNWEGKIRDKIFIFKWSVHALCALCLLACFFFTLLLPFDGCGREWCSRWTLNRGFLFFVSNFFFSESVVWLWHHLSSIRQVRIQTLKRISHRMDLLQHTNIFRKCLNKSLKFSGFIRKNRKKWLFIRIRLVFFFSRRRMNDKFCLLDMYFTYANKSTRKKMVCIAPRHRFYVKNLVNTICVNFSVVFSSYFPFSLMKCFLNIFKSRFKTRKKLIKVNSSEISKKPIWKIHLNLPVFHLIVSLLSL